MLSLRKIIFAICALTATVSVSEAVAGMYGFHHYNPYIKEERNLSFDELPQKLKNYRAYMRNNLLMLSRYAKKQKPEFKIITHEGQNLLTKSLWEYNRDGYNNARKSDNAEDESFLFYDKFTELEPERYTPAYEYLNLVDAIAINNLYCGKGKESKITANHKLGLINIDKCANEDELETARINAMIEKRIFYGFTDLDRAFNGTYDHANLNDSAQNIYEISDAQNILILTDDSKYTNKDEFVKELLNTNYDIIIIKPLFHNHERFSPNDIQKLHFKKNGSKRLLIAEMNISEASPYEYYWQKDWKIGSPSWLKRLSFSTKDSIITQYWHDDWKKIISRHFKDIINENFDGVFITGIENHEYFEQQNPLE